jgi:hypothetical protein
MQIPKSYKALWNQIKGFIPSNDIDNELDFGGIIIPISKYGSDPYYDFNEGVISYHILPNNNHKGYKGNWDFDFNQGSYEGWKSCRSRRFNDFDTKKKDYFLEYAGKKVSRRKVYDCYETRTTYKFIYSSDTEKVILYVTIVEDIDINAFAIAEYE